MLVTGRKVHATHFPKRTYRALTFEKTIKLIFAHNFKIMQGNNFVISLIFDKVLDVLRYCGIWRFFLR